MESSKKLEEMMPIATGHVHEELESELEGKNILEINHPVGPFGTKELQEILAHDVHISHVHPGRSLYKYINSFDDRQDTRNINTEIHDPFMNEEAASIVKSFYDVGCPRGEGEDEHDVVWFWLEKVKPHECSICSQYFKLEVVDPGGTQMAM
ncbi:cytochrome c oxidase subunit 5b-1, mitochondrial-like [Tripterygium wilfordii]|uniref:cytochrome c oxidase subunit 5b-1, mitochondrial-like n=1 Tax=Tripterygium wilfordii TaxID=458696 RepID=UPI0018F80016|nr:cytochrome c oxidase subunit 5b-1, mitochondrial-like [Tripterygium wilfordii]